MPHGLIAFQGRKRILLLRENSCVRSIRQVGRQHWVDDQQHPDGRFAKRAESTAARRSAGCGPLRRAGATRSDRSPAPSLSAQSSARIRGRAARTRPCVPTCRACSSMACMRVGLGVSCSAGRTSTLNSMAGSSVVRIDRKRQGRHGNRLSTNRTRSAPMPALRTRRRTGLDSPARGCGCRRRDRNTDRGPC